MSDLNVHLISGTSFGRDDSLSIADFDISGLLSPSDRKTGGLELEQVPLFWCTGFLGGGRLSLSSLSSLLSSKHYHLQGGLTIEGTVSSSTD